MGGGGVVLGEMDVAHVCFVLGLKKALSARLGKGDLSPPPVAQSLVRSSPPPPPPALSDHQLSVATGGLSLPGGRRSPGPDNLGPRWMGDESWRGQKEGSVIQLDPTGIMLLSQMLGMG